MISSFFRFSLLSYSVCRTGKYCLYIKMAERNSKKRKKSLFYEEKSLVGLTPGEDFFPLSFQKFAKFWVTIFFVKKWQKIMTIVTKRWCFFHASCSEFKKKLNDKKFSISNISWWNVSIWHFLRISFIHWKENKR